MLEPTGSEKGEFRRCSTGHLGEQDLPLLLCEIGNQDLESVECEIRASERTLLDEFLPPKWSGRRLDFISSEFERYVITVV